MDPSLSNQERYPYFFRTIPSEDLINIGRLQLLQSLGWFRIGMLSSTERVYARVKEWMFVWLYSWLCRTAWFCKYECLLFLQVAAKILQQAHSIPGMEITYYGSFSENTVGAFDQIYNSDVRIILGMFGEEFAQSVLCMVRQSWCIYCYFTLQTMLP